jgi:hypothetical protein
VFQELSEKKSETITQRDGLANVCSSDSPGRYVATVLTMNHGGRRFGARATPQQQAAVITNRWGEVNDFQGTLMRSSMA